MFGTMKKCMLLLLCLASGACGGNRRAEEALQRAEQTLPSAPDSALRILRGIDPGDLSRRRMRAEYALLYAMAQDKSYILATDDSLTRIARDYYRRHGDQRKRFLAEYYHATVQHNRKEDSRALVSFLRIEDEGRQLGDPYLLGQLYSQIAEIYRDQYNYPTMLQYARQAYDNYLRADKPYHCGYALFDIADAHSHMEHHDSAGIYYVRSLQLTEAERDTAMMHATMTSMALNHVCKREADEACALLWQIRHRLHRNWQDRDRIIMVLAQLTAHRPDSTHHYLHLAEALITPDSPNRDFLNSTAAEVHFHTGDYQQAAEQYRNVVIFRDSIEKAVLQHSYADVHRDYLDRRHRSDQRRIRRIRHNLIFIAALALVVASFAGFAAYVFYRKRQFVMQKYISGLDEIKSASKLMMLKLEAQHRRETEELQRLVKGRFDAIDELASTYYERRGANEQRAIYNKVKTLLESYASSAESKQEIETVVDMCYDNVMQRVRSELPQLKEAELDLLRYVYAGFSLRVISVFTGDSVNYTAVKKSRLKTKIAESDAPSKALFIELMS